jgi:phosphoglycolate phosphatase
MKTTYQHIIFDLNGTISDSREGIYNAYDYAIKELDLINPGKDKLKTLIGPPLQKGFAELFGLEGEQIIRAVKVFREYYATKGLFENKVYDGMHNLLEKLFNAGSSLYVATSKYELYANQVLEHFDIKKYFKEIAGADYNGTVSKVELITGLLMRNAVADPMDVVVIGDTKYDIDAATELAIDSIGVAYGFSTEDELTACNPDYIAYKVSDLQRFLLFGN